MASVTETFGKAGAGERSSRKAARRAPISLHPAFPFIVALWFAALLGIGSLMVPVPLLERLAEASGLSAIIPQAAPPLGFKARLALSIAATLGGGLVGLIIARKVAGLHRAADASPRFSQIVASSGVNARRPISAHDELGETGLDGTSSRGRRALAIEVDEGPSELFEAAPLPGGPLKAKQMVLSPARLADAVVEDQPHDDLAGDAFDEDDGTFAAEPLELSGLEMAEHAPFNAALGNGPGFSMLAGSMADNRDGKGDDGTSAGVHFPFRHSAASPAAKQMFEPDAADESGSEQVVEPVAELAADLHFSPPSLARGAASADDDAEDDGMASDQQPLPANSVTAPADLAALARQAQGMVERLEAGSFGPDLGGGASHDTILEDHVASTHDSNWQDGELDDLGLVQLAQRLGSSIEKRREARAAHAAAEAEAARLAAIAAVAAPVAPAPISLAPVSFSPTATVPADDFDMAEAEDAAEAMAAYFGKAAPEAPAAQDATPFGPTTVAPLEPAPAAEPAPQRQIFQPLGADQAIPAPAMPGSMAAIAIEDDGDDDGDDAVLNLAASFSLPLGRTEQPVAPAPVVVAPFNPFERKTQVFVRIEDEPQPEAGHVEPAVVFPGTETRLEPQAATSVPSSGHALDDLPPLNGLGAVRRSFDRPTGMADGEAPVRGNADENEKALREALLNLQRMSGAA